jgi:hypothetical protein
MTQLEQYIKSYFSIVDEKSLQAIASLFRITTFKKGDFFLKAGGYCNRLGFVEKGFLEFLQLLSIKKLHNGFLVKDISLQICRVWFFKMPQGGTYKPSRIVRFL